MLELKYIRQDILKKANELDAHIRSKDAYEEPIERAHLIGKLSGMLDSIEIINERIKAIEIDNGINDLIS
jgi:hypothetical protein